MLLVTQKQFSKTIAGITLRIVSLILKESFSPSDFYFRQNYGYLRRSANIYFAKESTCKKSGKCKNKSLDGQTRAVHCYTLRPHSNGLGYPRQPSPRVNLIDVTFSAYFFAKLNKAVYKSIANPSWGPRQLGLASLASAD